MIEHNKKRASDIVDSLYRISSITSATEDPHQALDVIVEEIHQALNASSASICLLNPDTKRLQIEAHRGLPEHAAEFSLDLGVGITGWVALHGEPAYVNDVSTDSRYFPLYKQVKSEMAVPMEDQGVIIGVVNVDSHSLNAFDEDALKHLTLLTNEAAKAVNRLWLIYQLKAKADHLQALINTSQILAMQHDLESVLNRIASQALEIMSCRLCAVFLHDPENSSLTLKAIAGASGPFDHEEHLQLDDSAIGTAIRHRKQVEVVDLLKTEEHHFVDIIRQESLVSLLSTPIIYEDEVIGVLNVYTATKHRFNNEEKTIFSTLASLGAVAIQNARLYARVFASEEIVRRSERLTTLGLLSAEIAHEIRNPLTVIKLLFDSLELDFAKEDPRKKDLEVITEKLDQLESIVGRVLQFGKAREGLHSRYDLQGLLEDTVHLVRLKLEQNRIDLECAYCSEPLCVEGNKGQLQQAFLNLVLNAIQVMPDGGKLSIEMMLEERETATSPLAPVAAICITDTGTGIPDEIKDRIFDSFLSGYSHGTGLGLSIVRRILKSHKGDIEVIDSSPQGTRMKMWLPLAQR